MASTEKWVCTRCGYIYDPENGDPEHGVPAGTPFDKLPDDWICPICYANKEEFDPL
jgi:rubredoxin